MKKCFTGIICVFLFLTGCTVGPDYKRPDTEIPAEFKGNKDWKVATPKAHLPKGEWWTVFNDPRLNELEQQAAAANQNLKAAVARVMQARALAGVARSELFPNADMTPSARRLRTPESGEPITYNLFSLPFDLSYEVDLWGRVRRSTEAARADVAAVQADYETALLTLQADVARTYFQIRSLDSEIQIVANTIRLRNESLKLVESRFRHGYTDKLDLERAKTELETTKAEVASLEKSRSELANSLAVLLGTPPSAFSLSPAPLTTIPPQVASGLPSALLERRPDVARAEQNVAAANARIGVAKAAFFPTITLTGSAGYQSSSTGSLLDWDSRVWSLGPGVSLPIFTGGRNQANLDKARAAYDETVATYRQTVLVSLQEVEDSLSGLGFLNKQADAQNRAVRAAKNAENLSDQRYKAGLVSYLEVVDAQRTALSAERSAVQVQGQQLVTTIGLIKAIGGGWE